MLVNPYEIKLECDKCGKEIGYEKYYGEEPNREELESSTHFLCLRGGLCLFTLYR